MRRHSRFATGSACQAAVPPHPQAEREAGPNGDSHRVQLVGGDPRSRQRSVHAAVYGRLVRLLSQLGHHTAPCCVDVGLCGQRLAQDAAAGAHDSHPSVVAAALDAQHQAGPAARSLVLCPSCIRDWLCCLSCCSR